MIQSESEPGHHVKNLGEEKDAPHQPSEGTADESPTRSSIHGIHHMMRSERPQGVQPSRPVGAEEEDDSHCMIPRRAIGHVDWFDTDWHVTVRGCQP